MLRQIIALLGFNLVTIHSLWSQEPAPDLILHHAKVVTVDARFTIAEAIAIRGERIVRTGSNLEIQALKGPQTESRDPGGKLVYPNNLFAGTAAASAGQSRIDTALLAAAQKAVPREITSNQLVRALEAGLWNSNRTAVAVSFAQPKTSVIIVFLRQTNGTYLAADASGVEGGNFGKLGRPRTDYERFTTTPVEWRHRDDGLFQVLMRTQAWRNGKRYTVSEPLLIRADGLVMFR